MGPDTKNINKDSTFHAPYAGRDMYNIDNSIHVNHITIFREDEREFVVTGNTNIKSVYYFTGRETELQELRQRTEKGRKAVLVSGMGGIGKTQICRKLFEEYNTRHDNGEDVPFRHIGYIEYDGDMGSSLMNCLRYKEQEKTELNQEAAWKELEDIASMGKLLLFVDNVNKPMSEDEGLQRLNRIPGAVMITSRLASFSDEFEPYRIGFLNTEQCIEIYEKIRFENSRKKVKPEELEDLKYIIENLVGWHTITVQLLANLARIKLWGIKRLREELENKGFQLEFHKNGELVNIQKSYEVLYSLSDLTEAEQNILEAFSVFPYIPLAADTCKEWLLADAGVSENDDVLVGLYQKGWLQFDFEQEGYAMHPVFAQFIYEKCKPRMEKHNEMIESCQRCLEIPQNDKVLECRKFISFAENIIKKIDMGICELHLNTLLRLAQLLQHVGEYLVAENLYVKILEDYTFVLMQDEPLFLKVCANTALVFHQQKEYTSAIELYKECLQLTKEVMGEEHPDNVVIYNNLAVAYMDNGEYEKAEELLKKSMDISSTVDYENALATSRVYYNLGDIYKRLGEERKAIEFYEGSLHIVEIIKGNDNPYTVGTYITLAQMHIKQGNSTNALNYLLKVYKSCKNKYNNGNVFLKKVYDLMQVEYSQCNPKGNFEQWLEEMMKE